MKRTVRWKLAPVEWAMVLLALLFLSPFYFVLINSFKSLGEIMLNSASWPTVYRWENFTNAWERIDLHVRFTNTLFITIAGNLGLIVLASMAAYRLARRQTKINGLLFALFISAMVIPFQSIMIPLIKVASWFQLNNSLPGIVICYYGLGVSLSIFFFRGFIRSIPLEIEESGRVDGCGPYYLYWKLVFPLLKPMSVTVLILNSLWMWNDFLLAQLMLQRNGLRTIQVAINSLFSEFLSQWDLALAALVISVLPLLLFFLLMQRFVIEGITAGAVKG